MKILMTETLTVLTNNFNKIMKMLNRNKEDYFNIPFADGLEQIPNYVKFMKEILYKKRRLGDFETVTLTEECIGIIQK